MRSVGVGDHVADVVGDDGGAVEAERGDDGADVLGLGLLVVAGGRDGGSADAAEVGHDDGVVAHEVGGERRPGVAVFGVAVNENNDRTVAAGAHEDVCPGGAVDGGDAKAGGERRLRERGERSEKERDDDETGLGTVSPGIGS